MRSPAIAMCITGIATLTATGCGGGVGVGGLEESSLQGYLNEDPEAGGGRSLELWFGVYAQYPGQGCPGLDPAMQITLNGREPNVADRQGCNETIGVYFKWSVPDEGGPATVRFADGGALAEVAFSIPPRGTLELVGEPHAAPNSTVTVRASQSFYDGRGFSPQGDMVIPREIHFKSASTKSWLNYPVMATAEQNEFRFDVPSYAEPGAGRLYLEYSAKGGRVPLLMKKCSGFRSCLIEWWNIGFIGAPDFTVD